MQNLNLHEKLLNTNLMHICSSPQKKRSSYKQSIAVFETKIDLHPLRVYRAKWACLYYPDDIRDPTFQEQLIKESEARWQFIKAKKWNPKEVEETYSPRGLNRELALKHNLMIGKQRIRFGCAPVPQLSVVFSSGKVTLQLPSTGPADVTNVPYSA